MIHLQHRDRCGQQKVAIDDGDNGSHTALPHRGEMNSAGDGDDEKADDDRRHRDVESVPAQAPGAVIVPLVVTLSGLEETKHEED